MRDRHTTNHLKFRLAVPTLCGLLAACASGDEVRPGATFTMAVGQTLSLPDATRLRYEGIANDSRCPPAVQCIRAGDADVLFTIMARHSATPLVLNTERGTSADLGPWRIWLLDLQPGAAPPATLRLETGASSLR